jgi:hypothetical protein
LVRMVAVTNVKGRHDTDDCGRPPRSPKSAAREIVVIRDELGPCQTEGAEKSGGQRPRCSISLPQGCT